MENAKITAIIPTEGTLKWKNHSLIYTIKSLQYQTGAEISIMVVTTGPTQEFLKEMNDLGVEVICTELKYCGERRNIGASYAKTSKILFIDDDTVILTRDAINKICNSLNCYDFVCGAHRYWSSFYWHKYLSPFLSQSAITTILSSISFLPKGINRVFGFRDLNEFTFIGNFGGINTELFLEVGGFGEQFPVYGFEDVDLMMRLCMCGATYELLYDKMITVVHLTHPEKTEESLDSNLKVFNAIQRKRGFYFQANHFFSVFEGDGHGILTPCDIIHKSLG